MVLGPVLILLLISQLVAAQEEIPQEELLPQTLTPVQLRALFLPEYLQDFADTNVPLPVTPNSTVPTAGFAQSCLEALELETGANVYIIGRAIGFVAAYFARNGMEVTVSEEETSLVDRYRGIWEDLGLTEIIAIGFSELKNSFGTRRFDAILIHAGVTDIPEVLTEMLAEKGIIIAPLSNHQDTQIMVLLKKDGTSWSVSTMENQFFPLSPLILTD
ncbi:MAG: protein-L-isoaspartate O-methyltransferase [Spirochaetaceae bacterium]|nr:protein-L-isoaspartate O-methyltransferase [Spirochaetaceae bacterium]MCF7948255.1 protein-L-isoaspartate O-methyltransferase [Spirochaetia bacterium]MCF7950948.1 protein-L-isoaspartate O-methyltransferase [Spirochaetaceae bacterium]